MRVALQNVPGGLSVTARRSGMPDAYVDDMGVKRVEDLVAFQRAVAFKEGIYVLVRSSPRAMQDWKWRDQIFDAAVGVESNIAEGWGRRTAKQICQFLDYAHASLDETRRRLLDGAARGYYSVEQCEALWPHERLCGAAIRGLRKSLEPYVNTPRR